MKDKIDVSTKRHKQNKNNDKKVKFVDRKITLLSSSYYINGYIQWKQHAKLIEFGFEVSKCLFNQTGIESIK